MSQNPFDLLGNDVEDATVVVAPPKEIVKKNTSSKKADVPPPSADPARANKNRPKPTGNEAAFKDKAAGRKTNRSKAAPEGNPKRSNVRKATDRHSRTGKVDSEKKVKQAWGDDNKEQDDEEAAAKDAAAELAADQEASEEGSNKKSLKDYLEEVSKNDLNKTPASKKTVEKFNDAELFVKEQEVFAEPTKVKPLKSKQLKTKQFLNFDATFSDDLPKPRRTNNTAPRRGGKKGGNNTRKAAPASSSKPAVTAANFPALA